MGWWRGAKPTRRAWWQPWWGGIPGGALLFLLLVLSGRALAGAAQPVRAAPPAVGDYGLDVVIVLDQSYAQNDLDTAGVRQRSLDYVAYWLTSLSLDATGTPLQHRMALVVMGNPAGAHDWTRLEEWTIPAITNGEKGTPAGFAAAFTQTQVLFDTLGSTALTRPRAIFLISSGLPGEYDGKPDNPTTKDVSTAQLTYTRLRGRPNPPQLYVLAVDRYHQNDGATHGANADIGYTSWKKASGLTKGETWFWLNGHDPERNGVAIDPEQVLAQQVGPALRRRSGVAEGAVPLSAAKAEVEIPPYQDSLTLLLFGQGTTPELGAPVLRAPDNSEVPPTPNRGTALDGPVDAGVRVYQVSHPLGGTWTWESLKQDVVVITHTTALARPLQIYPPSLSQYAPATLTATLYYTDVNASPLPQQDGHPIGIRLLVDNGHGKQQSVLLCDSGSGFRSDQAVDTTWPATYTLQAMLSADCGGKGITSDPQRLQLHLATTTLPMETREPQLDQWEPQGPIAINGTAVPFRLRLSPPLAATAGVTLTYMIGVRSPGALQSAQHWPLTAEGGGGGWWLPTQPITLTEEGLYDLNVGLTARGIGGPDPVELWNHHIGTLTIGQAPTLVIMPGGPEITATLHHFPRLPSLAALDPITRPVDLTFALERWGVRVSNPAAVYAPPLAEVVKVEVSDAAARSIPASSGLTPGPEGLLHIGLPFGQEGTYTASLTLHGVLSVGEGRLTQDTAPQRVRVEVQDSGWMRSYLAVYRPLEGVVVLGLVLLVSGWGIRRWLRWQQAKAPPVGTVQFREKRPSGEWDDVGMPLDLYPRYQRLHQDVPFAAWNLQALEAVPDGMGMRVVVLDAQGQPVASARMLTTMTELPLLGHDGRTALCYTPATAGAPTQQPAIPGASASGVLPPPSTPPLSDAPSARE